MTTYAKHVYDLIIDPMTRLYQPPVHLRTDEIAYSAMLMEYSNSLKHFSAETLAKAWEIVKTNHETWMWPHKKAIFDACMDSQPKKDIRESITGLNLPKENPALADRVMRSHIGQFAIKHGVGSSVWLKALVDSNEVRHESEVLTIRDKWLEAIDLLAAMPKGENRDRLTGIYEAMQAREQRIALKYAPMEIAA